MSSLCSIPALHFCFAKREGYQWTNGAAYKVSFSEPVLSSALASFVLA